MPRTIVRRAPKVKVGIRAEALAVEGISEEDKDKFLAKLGKYIPAEINATFLFLHGIMNSITNFPILGYWMVFVALTVFSPLYFWYVAVKEKQKPDKAQIAISPVAFAIWVFAIGGPFAFYSWYVQAYGAIVLGIATLAIPMVDFIITRKTEKT